MSTLETITLTDPGEGLTEAEILDVKVAVGDMVEINDPLVEVETEKSAVELPSPVSGRVVRVLVSEGDELAVGAPMLEVDTDATGEQPAPDPSPAADEATPAAEQTAPAANQAAPAEEQAPAEPEEPKPLVGYGAKPGSSRRRRKATVQQDATQVPIDRILAKPPVRKLARDLGIALADVLATGPGGSVTRDDVLAAQQRSFGDEPVATTASADGAYFPDESPQAPADLADNMQSSATHAMAPANSGVDQNVGSGYSGITSDGRTTRVPIRSVRKRTAEAMVSSAFTAPHVTVFNEVDMTSAMDLVRRLRGSREWKDVKVSPLAVIAKALLVAIRRNPEVNAAWDEDSHEIVYKHFVNLGIAAATPRGLIVPNIKDAHLLTLKELAESINDLAKTARAGATPLSATRGGTITITNFGVFGIDSGTPILNPGESVIVGVGAVKEKPWVVDGRIEIREVAQIAVSFDHRLIDGELGSVLLRDVSAVLEHPDLGLVWG
jgi:2-oxoisovalerate dehydrogenase E2 component (dihydrolipoyl transacylase)